MILPLHEALKARVRATLAETERTLALIEHKIDFYRERLAGR